MSVRAVAAALLGVLAWAAAAAADVFPGRPDAVIDLGTREGADLVKGQWRYSDARIVEADFRAPGPDLRPSGPPVRTHDYAPKAGSSGFDDSRWEAIAADTLQARRGSGKLSLAWYRIAVTIPERIAGFDPTGATVVFEIVVDDYAEIWVDGKLPRALGQKGGALIGGFNAPNRLVVGRDVRPGQTIQLAVFAVNGPISDPPANYIWIRSATLDFYRPKPATAGVGRIIRLDGGLDAIVPGGAVIEKLAGGFQFTEGPLWADGALLFSDPDANRIYRWTPDGDVSVFRTKSGYSGPDVAEYGQPGSNGLARDRQGRLTINEHGRRRVVRLEPNGVVTVLADRYQGKRLNSPNDLVYKSDGALYFTDPPFGLPRFHDDPRRELPFSGIFRWADGTLQLLDTELTGPNGLAFSPDEKYLYVTNWDVRKKVVMRYPVKDDGTLGPGRVFFDMTGAPGQEALDGVKVDRRGNLYVSGPGGAWIISPEGTHLGSLEPPELPANFAWGDDGRTLYMTARTGLYRIRLGVAGSGPDF